MLIFFLVNLKPADDYPLNSSITWNTAKLNIFDSKNHDSGNMETGIPERKLPLIGLITINKKLNECQDQSRFAGCKPDLHW